MPPEIQSSETIASFAQRIKQKYPAYAGVEDAVLVERILEKYPMYQERVSPPSPPSFVLDGQPEPTAPIRRGALGVVGTAYAPLVGLEPTPEEEAGLREAARAFGEAGEQPIVPLTKLFPEGPPTATITGFKQPSKLAEARALVGEGPSPYETPEIPVGGIARGAAEFVEGLTTPLNIALLTSIGLTGGAFPIVSRLVSGGFSLHMIRGIVQQRPELREAINAGDEQRTAQVATRMGLTSVLAVLTGRHALRGRAATGEVSRVRPEVERAAEAKPARPTEPLPPPPPGFVLERPVETVRRFEEPGVAPTLDKPQGLYLTPAKETLPPTVERGMVPTEWEWHPQNPLDVSEVVRTPHRGGVLEASAGVKALKRIIGPEKFAELIRMGRRELSQHLVREHPKVKWERYYDAYEMLEGYGGIKARAAGYDALVDRSPHAPEFSEYVALKPSAAKRIPTELQRKAVDEFGDTIERGGRVVDSLGRSGKVLSVGALVQDLETGKAVFREDTLKVDFGKGPEPVPIGDVTVKRHGRPKALEGIGGRRARLFGETEQTEMERFAREGGFETLGAAKKGEGFSTKANIAQLTESLSREPASTSVAERVSQSKKIAESISGTKDTLARAANVVLADGVAARDILLRPPKWTSFEDALGKFDGAIQVNARDLREFSHRVGQSFPNKVRREAITNWIQAEGNAELLGQRAKASKSRLRRGYEEAARLTEDEQIFARNISSYFDGKLEEAIDAGLMEQGIENYVNQIWHRPDNPVANLLMAEAGRRAQLRPNPSFIKKRIFATYFEGEQAGFKPKNKDISFLVSAYDQAFNKAIYSRALIKSLLERKAEDGRPIATPSGGGIQVPKGEQPPEAYLVFPRARPEEAADYRPINHPALRKWTWATKDAEGKPIFVQGDILIHPAHARHLKNAFGTSALRKSRIGRGVLRGVRELKATLLSFSGFHQVQEGLHALGHKVVPFRTERIDLSKPKQRALAEHGLQIATFDGAEMFAEGVASTGLVHRLPIVGGYLQRYTDWLFHEHIPELKMGMALEALDRNRQRYPKLSEDQLMKLTSQQANGAFGELNYRMMGRNPTFQDTLRLATLAPDFLEARARFVGQALKPYGREQAAALIRLSLGLFVTTRIVNKVFDDDYHWDRPFSFVIGGREFTLRTVPGDIVHLLTNPRNFIYWRINPTLTRPVIEFLTGRDALGRKRILWEQLKDWILGHVPIPLQSIVDERDRKVWEGLLQSLGIGTFQYRTAAERLAGQYVGDLMPSRGTTAEQRKKSRFRRQLSDRIQAGDKAARKEALAALRDKTINQNDYSIILRDSRRPRIYNLVNRLPLEQAMDVWEKASKEERKAIYTLMLRKRSLLMNETPERRAILEARLNKLLRGR